MSAVEIITEEMPSPFLPGTNIQYAWDSTSLGYLKTCPRLYQYHMIEGWQAKGESIHLRFGIEYHQALQDYDICKSTGITHDEALFDTVRALLLRIADWNPDPQRPSEEVKSKTNLVRTVIWYLDHFEHDQAKTMILKDGTPAVELSFRFELDWGPQAGEVLVNDDGGILTSQPYLLCGHLDRVVDYQGETYVMDRKTTGSTPGSYYFDQYAPHNQMSLYTFAGQIVLDSPIKGVIIDAAQIAVGFSRFTRGMTFRTPDQINEWLGDLAYWFGLAEQYANEGYWPMNDMSCDKYGGCRFREVCSKSPQVREPFLRSKFEKGKPWNPLEPR